MSSEETGLSVVSAADVEPSKSPIPSVVGDAWSANKILQRIGDKPLDMGHVRALWRLLDAAGVLEKKLREAGVITDQPYRTGRGFQIERPS